MRKFRIICDNQNVVVKADDIFDAIILFDVDKIISAKKLLVKEIEE